jgi:hypothetical protein
MMELNMNSRSRNKHISKIQVMNPLATKLSLMTGKRGHMNRYINILPWTLCCIIFNFYQISMEALVTEILQFQTGNNEKTTKLVSGITNMNFDYHKFLQVVSSVNKEQVCAFKGCPFFPIDFI